MLVDRHARQNLGLSLSVTITAEQVFRRTRAFCMVKFGTILGMFVST
jgi:hypothetical protein